LTERGHHFGPEQWLELDLAVWQAPQL
jgi:hypothetical protein